MRKQFYHWSAKPVSLRPLCYLQQFDHKPRGFWFEVNGEWKEWCDENSFGLDRLLVCHEVRLLDDSRVLKMRTAAELVQFTKEFAAEIYPGQRAMNDEHSWLNLCGIDWPRVSKQYDGILIAPYVWECRMNLIWYYGFDCASGCVWNTEILQVRALEPSATVSPNAAPPGAQTTES